MKVLRENPMNHQTIKPIIFSNIVRERLFNISTIPQANLNRIEKHWFNTKINCQI